MIDVGIVESIGVVVMNDIEVNVVWVRETNDNQFN
jgi:hypothetical protein